MMKKKNIIFFFLIIVSSFYSSKSHAYSNENELVVCVGEEKNDYKTINEALDYARYYATFNYKVTIHIREGEYNESIFLLDNPGVNLIGDGVGKTVIKSNTRYPNATICATGDMYVEGITFISTGGSDAYAFHYEIANSNVQGYTVFKDCEFISEGEVAAIGAGLGENCTLELDNCRITNNNGMGLYFHNNPYSHISNQNIVLNNCIIETDKNDYAIVIDDSASFNGNTNSAVIIKINRLVTTSKKIMFRDEQGVYEKIPINSENFVVSEESMNNDIECLNFSNNKKGTLSCVTIGVIDIIGHCSEFMIKMMF